MKHPAVWKYQLPFCSSSGSSWVQFLIKVQFRFQLGPVPDQGPDPVPVPVPVGSRNEFRHIRRTRLPLVPIRAGHLRPSYPTGFRNESVTSDTRTSSCSRSRSRSRLFQFLFQLVPGTSSVTLDALVFRWFRYEPVTSDTRILLDSETSRSPGTLVPVPVPVSGPVPGCSSSCSSWIPERVPSH